MALARQLLGEAVKQIFDGSPRKAAFRISEIATVALGRRPMRHDEYWVASTLTRTREWLERTEGITFTPVTDHYFRHYNNGAQPRSEAEARRCVAGVGRSRGTVGIRRLWPKGRTDDLISRIWLEQGYKSGGNKWHLVTNRVLVGYNLGALTKSCARTMLEDNFHRLMPNDRSTFLKLLPIERQGQLMLDYE